MRQSFILGDSNWKCVQVLFVKLKLPVDTPTDLNVLLNVPSRIVRLSLARNLRPCQLYKEYPDRPKDPKTLSDILAPSAEIKTKDKNFLHKKPSRKRKGNQQKKQMHTQILNKNELVIIAEEEKGKYIFI